MTDGMKDFYYFVYFHVWCEVRCDVRDVHTVRLWGGTKAGNQNRLKCFVDKMDENPIGTTRTFPVQVHEPG
jgi:hypothetical protein